MSHQAFLLLGYGVPALLLVAELAALAAQRRSLASAERPAHETDEPAAAAVIGNPSGDDAQGVGVRP